MPVNVEANSSFLLKAKLDVCMFIKHALAHLPIAPLDLGHAGSSPAQGAEPRGHKTEKIHLYLQQVGVGCQLLWAQGHCRKASRK